MELVNFSVSNFRSITKAHKVYLSDTTILIGRNNEGKSNLLKALDVGMISLQRHAFDRPLRTISRMRYRMDEKYYLWERDFPINLQMRKSSTQTIIRFEFRLDEAEIEEFKNRIKSNLNGTLPIIVKIGKDNYPTIEVSKRGKGSKTLNQKSEKIAKFIADKILFNYIPAVRTDQEAIDVVSRMLSQRLRFLEDQDEYMKALQTIKNLQQPILDELSARIKEPLKEFLPGIKKVDIRVLEHLRRSSLRRDFDIIIDDGTPTNIAFKGDGVKSLVALGLLKDRVSRDGASIIAIEEPESHLHPSAIQQLNQVIKGLGTENQVILTTHNPLFVDRVDMKANIIVDCGTALPAKNIKQIREILGIKASDNLINANYVLVVEGDDDVISLKALLSEYSPKLKKNIDNHIFIIDSIGGAGNLPYKLSLLKNTLCVYHCLLDNDDAGRRAFEQAEKDGLLTIKDNTFVTCNGFTDSELEDCFNVDLYKSEIKNEYGLDLNDSAFRNNKKWSVRLKSAFLNQGKLWNKSIEKRVKNTVANCVKANPSNSLNAYKKGFFNALMKSLESLINI